MGFSYNVSVLNQKGSPAIYTDTFANRPPFGYAGRLFIANDTSAIYEDTGTAWVLIANVSSGAGTLQQVTTNGNTSNVGISVTAGGISTNSLTDTALTLGSVLFSGAAGLVTQDNAAFFWDDTNNRLGLNTVTPSNTLDIHFAGTGASVGINNTAGNSATIVYANTGSNKWRVGNSATNTFDFFNVVLSAIALTIKANNSATFISNVTADEFILQPTGYTVLASLSRNLTGAGYGVLSLKNSATGTIQPTILTVDRTYTLPDATGTLALTSNLSSYLPLSGGTLTGNLGGTTASFSSDITLQYSKSLIWNTASNQYIGADINNLALGTGGVNRLLINIAGEVAVGNTPESTVKFKVTGTTSDSTAFTYFARNLSGSSIFSIRNDGLTSFGLAANSPYNYNVTFAPRTAGLDASGGFGYIVSTRESKGNINSINNIDYLKNLNPVSFNYRKKNIENLEYIDELYDDVYYGFIADEVEKVNKDLVFYENNENKKLSGVEYNSLIAILTKAYQDQQIIIDNLLKRIELLENK